MKYHNNNKKRRITLLFSMILLLVIANTAACGGPQKTPSPPDNTTSHTSGDTELQTDPVTQKESSIESPHSSQESTSAETPSETQTPLPQETEDSSKPLIVIDAGHQGPGQDMSRTEPIAPGSSSMKARIVTGTYGRTTGLNEYELTLSVSLQLETELKARGYRVVMTRSDHNIDLGNIQRAQIANENQADAMIRIHANGSDDSRVKGALTMSPSPDNPYVPSPQECLRLSQNIIDSFCAATGLENDGLLYTDEMTGINWCQVPVTILEMGFMTNPDDDTYLADAGHYPVMVKGIADGLDQFFGN